MSFLFDYAEARLKRIGLGAAQIGMPYGVANQSGKPDRDTAFSILDTAGRTGVSVLDTAQSYGDSERLIGEYRAQAGASRFHIVSKLAAGHDYANADAVLKAVEISVRTLGQPLAALLMHDPSQLYRWNDGVGAAMNACVAAGLAEAAGVSIYTPEEFTCALGIPEIKVIQAPFNVLDRRLLLGGQLDDAIGAGKIVFLRSVFLQGLLLMASENVPERLNSARDVVQRWRDLCARHGINPAAAALKYARLRAPQCITLVGCEQPAQLLANVADLEGEGLPESLAQEIDALPIPPEHVVNPSLWKKA